MAKEKGGKKKKDRQSADSQKSLGTTAEKQTTDNSHEGGRGGSAGLLNPQSGGGGDQVDGADNTLGGGTMPEMTQSKVVEQKMFEEPVLTKLIVEEYVGDKEMGLYHGYGEAKFVGGHTYKGEFYQGKMHGKGEYVWEDGIRYEGDFTLNHITGKGFYRWTDGSTYEGDVLNGLRHGNGTYTCPERGLCYSGQWHKGKRHGEGILYYDPAQQSFYEGEWFLNMKNGRGVRRYASGNVYDGMWYRDKRHGYGRMQWLDHNNALYEGEWEDGLQHGDGEYTWYLRRLPDSQYPQRNRYYGQWYKGARHGMGTFIYANGSRYRGPWNNNLKHGPGGVITFRTGRVLEGEFNMDKMVDNPELDIGQAATPEIDQLPGSKQQRPKSGTGSRVNFTDDQVSIKSDGSVSSQSSQLQSSFALSLDSILDTLPAQTREEEQMQIKFCVIRNVSLLRKIYAFYAKLCKESIATRLSQGGGAAGQPHPQGSSAAAEDNTFVMEKLQFWQLLKDCRINEHEVTLVELDRLVGANIELNVDGVPPPPPVVEGGGEDGASTQFTNPHQPNARMLFLDFVNSLIYTAYHVFAPDAKTQNCQHIVASCLSMLLEKRLTKYACKIKGGIMTDPVKAKITFDYLPKVFDIYSFLCKPLRVPPKNFPADKTICARDVLHMMNDYKLLNERLTTKVAMQILAKQDRRIYDEEDCNLELELTLLEFMESLLSFATIFVTDEVLKEPKGASELSRLPQITLEQDSGLWPPHGRFSEFTDDVIDPMGGVGDVPSKTAVATPGSQYSQADGFVDGEEATASANNNEDATQTGGAQPVTAGNESTTERGKADKKAGGGTADNAGENVGGSGAVLDDQGVEESGVEQQGGDKKEVTGEEAMQQSSKPSSGEENVPAEEPLFGSRPLTRGASNMTSARSSRFVDWGGDTEDELDSAALPVELRLWVQQVRCFFDRKLLPQFHKHILLHSQTQTTANK